MQAYKQNTKYIFIIFVKMYNLGFETAAQSLRPAVYYNCDLI